MKPKNNKTKKCMNPNCKNKNPKTTFDKKYNQYRVFCTTCSKGGLTLKKFIIKWGKNEGTKKWNIYKEKQAYTNSFEYKQKKYGITKKEFNAYNKSRAITLKNCINKYGKKEGKNKFNDYCNKQKTVGCTLEYFQEKYGKKKGKEKYLEINNNKKHTLDNYITKHGEEKGTKKYFNYIKNKKVGFFSKISKELFDVISENLQKIYYGKNEYGIYDSKNKTYYKYDFVYLDRMKIIEFNGEKFHPKKKHDQNFKNPYDNTITSEQIWNRDKNKKKCAEKMGFEVMYVWEDKYRNNKEKTIEKCLEFLK